METQFSTKKTGRQNSRNEYRSRLLDSIPVRENRYTIAGLSTAVLEGGQGPPVILLHGPGESSLWWMRVIPDLMNKYHVIAPDLPGHGATGADIKTLDEQSVSRWVHELIQSTCLSAPVLVGHILGGSIAARYAVKHADELERLVLANSLGLGKFRPSPGFAFGLIRFMIRPSRKNYNKFLPHCMYDVGELQSAMGTYWEPFLKYTLDCARNPKQKAALRVMMQQVGVPQIPSEDLAGIRVPAGLIWGHHDRANKLHIAEAASKRYGWPLHIIEDSRDDPKLEQPQAFSQALQEILESTESIEYKNAIK